ncbi:MAG TPA: fused MFS/spermidine synthase [Ktedonobacterales bacterium]|nr:fused MFS/spermidine synthase [Ktedonobacterales bacterium]
MRLGSTGKTAPPSVAPGVAARWTNMHEALKGALARHDVAHIRLRALVFVGGVASLGLELSASRLLGPWFGTSLFVWANIIGFFLLYLALGYFLGGRLADRRPDPRLLAALVAVAGVATGIIPFISRPVLDWSVSGLDNANASVFYSSMLAVILLFALPVTLLGFVSPFAVRLSVRQVGSSGRSAGGLYALSTAGSILGAFLPVLVLIPAWGVRRTLLAIAVALLAVALIDLPGRLRIPAALIGLVLLVPLLLPQVAPLGALKLQPGLVFDQESFYNYIQVVHTSDGTMELILNEGHAIHSVYNPNQILTGWYWDYFLAAPYFNAGPAAGQVRRVAIIGLAGGTIARQFTAVYGPVPIDGVEIDPAIVQVGRRYFGMTERNLNVFTADGRTFMRVTRQRYDVVAIDAFQQPYIPFQLTTKEFFQEIRAHLSPTGVVCLNTGHTRTDFRLVQAFVNTLSQVFPSVYVFNVPNTFNTEVMATMQPTSLDAFRANLAQVSPDSLMATVAGEVVPVAQVAHADEGGIVFTDDRAPIEQVTDQLLLNYIQQGG